MSEPKTPWNPSRRATKRVKNPLPPPEECPHCGSPVNIVTHEQLYGRTFSDWPYVYRCVNNSCDSHVGLHPFTNIPLGTLANPELREIRMRAKKLFQPLWREHGMNRNQAYELLAKELGIKPKDCHFGWFDIEQCQKAIEALERINARRSPMGNAFACAFAALAFQ
jgi:hypothetical protein